MTEDMDVVPDISDAGDETITVTKDMDIQESHFIYSQITEKSKKILDYDYKRCTGCGICVGLCPTKALELGPMHEIATGMDAPPVMMDLEKCTFCGMCANFCPVHAFNMEFEGELPDEDNYPVYDSYVKFNEKCLPCVLCEAVCPEDAIEVEFTFKKKEEIAPFKKDAKGEIEIDMDKCNFCGICAKFCDAFIMVEREPTPTDLTPFQQILVDEDKCDYCVLCQDLCPEDAIRVKGERPCEAPSIEGNITVDDKKCTRCTWCKAVCPYDAVDVKKPFEGELVLVEGNIDKCDPQGCHGCFNVCPSHLWYVPEDTGKKIAIKEDYCTYCGACVNACHVDVMRVSRDKVNHTEIPDSPWASQWKDAVGSMVTSKRNIPDISRTLKVEKEPPREHVEVVMPEFDESLLNAARERIEKAMPALKNVKIRRTWECKPADEARAAVIKHMKKAN
ncbi:MAG: 4Fe-4S binding protein [Methanosarcinaceae archaeon]|nr:4Fe-4S binding protein [Methanosarcinaceae archaeon]